MKIDSESIEKALNLDTPPAAKKVVMLIGYRKVIAKRIVDAKDNPSDKDIALYNEANDEIRKLLIL